VFDPSGYLLDGGDLILGVELNYADDPTLSFKDITIANTCVKLVPYYHPLGIPA
jgi:hypothetical protein